VQDNLRTIVSFVLSVGLSAISAFESAKLILVMSVQSAARGHIPKFYTVKIKL